MVYLLYYGYKTGTIQSVLLATLWSKHIEVIKHTGRWFLHAVRAVPCSSAETCYQLTLLSALLNETVEQVQWMLWEESQAIMKCCLNFSCNICGNKEQMVNSKNFFRTLMRPFNPQALENVIVPKFPYNLLVKYSELIFNDLCNPFAHRTT